MTMPAPGIFGSGNIGTAVARLLRGRTVLDTGEPSGEGGRPHLLTVQVRARRYTRT
jgi:predicted dinucleotide-binding enzyme